MMSIDMMSIPMCCHCFRLVRSDTFCRSFRWPFGWEACEWIVFVSQHLKSLSNPLFKLASQLPFLDPTRKFSCLCTATSRISCSKWSRSTNKTLSPPALGSRDFRDFPDSCIEEILLRPLNSRRWSGSIDATSPAADRQLPLPLGVDRHGLSIGEAGIILQNLSQKKN